MSTEFDALGAIGMIPAIWSIVSQSAVFTVLKVFLVVYSLVLIADVILLVLMRGVTGNLKVQIYGTARPLIRKNEATKKWESIERRLESDNPSHYKVAILEADHFADSLLKESGFDGENMSERLANMHPGQLQSYQGLSEAHAIRNRIVNEPAFTLDREQAQDILEKYKGLLIELELFS
ncbi:MAG: hypothetical protein WAT84_03160 [Candidatus Moraniibacteriota bacterium]